MPDLTFGQLVARERTTRSWSQDELAAKSGLSTRAVSAIEQGRVKDPRISTVRALARALGESFFTEAYRYTDIRESA